MTSEATAGGTFPMQGGDARHTGYVPGTVTADSGSLRWVSTLENTPRTDGRVATRGESVYVAGKYLHSLNQADGSVEWCSDESLGLTSTPAVAGDALVITGSDVETNLHVSALDPVDGAVLWRNDDVGEAFGEAQPPVAGDVIYASRPWRQPTVADGVAYVTGGTDKVEKADGLRHSRGRPIGAVDLSTGDLLWTRRDLDQSKTSPAVGDGGVFFQSGSVLRRLDPADGSTVWRDESIQRIGGPPTVVNGTVYAQQFGGGFGAWDAGTGEQEWWYDGERYMRFAAAVVDDRLYLAGDEHIVAVRTGDETYEWQRSGTQLASDLEGHDGFSLGWLLATDDTLYVGTNDPDGVLAVRRDDGTARWHREFRTRTLGGDMSFGGTPSGLALTDDVLFAFTGAGDLYAIAR